MYLHAECPGKIRPIENTPGNYIIKLEKIPNNTRVVFLDLTMQEIPKNLTPYIETVPCINVSFSNTKIQPFVLTCSPKDVWLPFIQPNDSIQQIEITTDVVDVDSLVIKLTDHRNRPLYIMNWCVRLLVIRVPS